MGALASDREAMMRARPEKPEISILLEEWAAWHDLNHGYPSETFPQDGGHGFGSRIPKSVEVGRYVQQIIQVMQAGIESGVGENIDIVQRHYRRMPLGAEHESYSNRRKYKPRDIAKSLGISDGMYYNRKRQGEDWIRAGLAVLVRSNEAQKSDNP